MADTVKIRRANVVLHIPNDKAVIDRYLADGFDVIGDGGKIVQRSTHGRSEQELRVELDELRAKYDKLVKENKDLKAKLDALIADYDEPEDTPVEAPKKKRTSKPKN